MGIKTNFFCIKIFLYKCCKTDHAPKFLTLTDLHTFFISLKAPQLPQQP